MTAAAQISADARRYYAGARRLTTTRGLGVAAPCRVMALPRSHSATLALIKAAAETRSPIEPGTIPEAPTFCFIPAEPDEKTAAPPERPTAAGRKSYCEPMRADWRGIVKHWRPTPISLESMHRVPMAGDTPEMTRARAALAGGGWRKLKPDPAPMAALLAAMAAERRQSAPEAARAPETRQSAPEAARAPKRAPRAPEAPQSPQSAPRAPERAPERPTAATLAPRLPVGIRAIANRERGR